MIDPRDYELTDEEHEALVAISEHAVALPLSPAAQAVLIAYDDASTVENGLAASIRVLANQFFPYEPEPHWWQPVRPHFRRQCQRKALLRIADELEAVVNA
jgi:hypothetical protein